MKAYNKNNAGVKRILREAAELSSDPSSEYAAQPLEDNLFEWHCTMRGPKDTEFEGGLYHFRISLPSEYPFRPPSIIMLTPSGRFECGSKICISFTNYHEELWQPAWGVRTAIVALQGFFPLKGSAAVGLGAVEYPESERKRLAAMSTSWTCPDCGKCNEEILPPPEASTSSVEPPILDEKKHEEPSSDIAQDGPASFQASNLPDLHKSGPMQSVVPVSNVQPPQPPPASTPFAHVNQQSQQPRREVVQSSRPPILLDGAICTLLVMVAALLFRRVF